MRTYAAKTTRTGNPKPMTQEKCFHTAENELRQLESPQTEADRHGIARRPASAHVHNAEALVLNENLELRPLALRRGEVEPVRLRHDDLRDPRLAPELEP